MQSPSADIHMTSDVDTHPSNLQTLAHVSPAHQKVIEYIESTFDHIIHEIQVRPHGKPVITLRRITAINPYYDHSDYMRLKWHIEDRPMTYSFPGKNKEEAWRFACLGRVLGEIYIAIKNDILVTKRDIYYHDPALFKHQGLVDRLVDDIAHTCGVTRRDLHVVASPKGLVAGFKDEVITVPDIFQHTQLDGLGHVKWILVVEKEATFKALVEQSLHHHPTLGSGIIVTAKGYPDLATRKFLRMLCDQLSPPVPLWGLFDLDPDGMRILKCYLYGSKTLAHEQECNLPEMKWIGLRYHHLLQTSHDSSMALYLTPRDRAVAVSILDSHEWRDEFGQVLPCLVGCHVELQRMLLLNRKAEIQALDDLKGGVMAYLTEMMKIGDS